MLGGGAKEETVTLIRLEPVLDERSGNYFLEIYHPHDAAEPFVTTQPRYRTSAAAETDLIAIVAAAASTGGKQSSG
jgi:hypothetical protein